MALEEIAESLKTLNSSELQALESYAYKLRRYLEKKDEKRLANLGENDGC
jgi:hypothetical protein